VWIWVCQGEGEANRCKQHWHLTHTHSDLSRRRHTHSLSDITRWSRVLANSAGFRSNILVFVGFGSIFTFNTEFGLRSKREVLTSPPRQRRIMKKLSFLKRLEAIESSNKYIVKRLLAFSAILVCLSMPKEYRLIVSCMSHIQEIQNASRSIIFKLTVHTRDGIGLHFSKRNV